MNFFDSRSIRTTGKWINSVVYKLPYVEQAAALCHINVFSYFDILIHYNWISVDLRHSYILGKKGVRKAHREIDTLYNV